MFLGLKCILNRCGTERILKVYLVKFMTTTCWIKSDYLYPLTLYVVFYVQDSSSASATSDTPSSSATASAPSATAPTSSADPVAEESVTYLIEMGFSRNSVVSALKRCQ